MYEVRGHKRRLKLFTHSSTFKQPKRRIKMAAQSCTFSTTVNAEKKPNFEGQKKIRLILTFDVE